MKVVITIVFLAIVSVGAFYFLTQSDQDTDPRTGTDCDLVGKFDQFEYGVDYEYINPNDKNRITADCAPIRYLR